MAEEKLNLLEMAIMDGVRKNMNEKGIAERAAIGKHCRRVVSDYDAPGPTLWTETMTRNYADAIEGLIEKGYLDWQTFIIQVKPTDKGR